MEETMRKRTIKITYPKNKDPDGRKKGHVWTDDGPACGCNLKMSLGGTYTISNKSQAPDKWCKTCKRLTTFPWEDEE
jgi:hypothetical protein